VKLPNGDNAVVDMAKLVSYCLDPAHWRGKHKARVFESALGITADNADQLRDALLAAARSAEATPTLADEYGQRFVVEFSMTGPGGSAVVRSAWIVPAGEGVPRLMTCYVK
jgi:hypothetical protein